MGALSAADLTRLRTTRHATRLGLVVYAPPTIWSGRVLGAHAQGATAIAVDGVVQVRAPARHMLVCFGTAAGARDLGDARFRAYSAPTLTVSAHNAQLPDDAYVTVVEEIKPTAIHPTIDDNDVVREDGDTAYTDENVAYLPLARAGTHAVAYRDATTGLATVQFYSRSTAIAPGATLAAHAWSFRGGTPATSASPGTAEAPIAVTWDAAGDYYCSLTVTDSNGKSCTRYFVVFVRDRVSGTLPYTALELLMCEGDVESGAWRATVRVHADAPASAFPNQALVVLFAEDWYGADRVSIGGERYREHIVCAGYIRRGTTKKGWAAGTVEFEIESVSGVMENLWQIAGGLETTAGTPGGWHVLKDLTYNVAAHHLLTQHSTLAQVADCYLNLPTYSIEYVDLIDGSLAEELRQVCAPVRGRMGCSAQGALYLEPHPQLQALAARSQAFVLTTDPADLRDDIDLGDEGHEKQVSQVDFVGEDANADPVFALAPATPWPSGRSERVDGVRVDDQVQANECAGLFEGYRNNVFGDVVLNWRGNYRVFDVFPAEPIAVNLAAAENPRGIAWTQQRCWTKRVSYEYRPGGVLLVSTVVEKDAYGSPGIAGDYPVEEPVWPPPTPPPVEPPLADPPTPSTPGPTSTPGRGNLLYVATLKGVAKCVGAYDGAPVWTSQNNGLAGNALKVRGLNFDAWSKSGTAFTRMWAMTDDGLYRGDGFPDAGAWTQKLSLQDAADLIGQPLGSTVLCYAFTPSVRIPNFIMTAAYYVSGSYAYLYVLWSTDNGEKWQCDASKYVRLNNSAPPQSRVFLSPSYHLDGVYYLHGDLIHEGNQTYPTGYPSPTVTILRATALPNFQPAASYQRVFPWGFDTGRAFVWPFCDAAGAVYADDNRAYDRHDLTPIVRTDNLFNPAWSPGYAGFTGTEKGTVVPAATNGGPPLFFNMWDESFVAWVDGVNALRTSVDACDTWTPRTKAAGGRTFNVTNLFMVPAAAQEFFTAGPIATGGGVAAVMRTADLGANFADISNYGSGNALDTVLGLVAGDMASAYVIVDYNQV